MHLLVQQMTSLPVSVLVLGIGIARHQSIGYWVLGAKLGIVLTLVLTAELWVKNRAYRMFGTHNTFRNRGRSDEKLARPWYRQTMQNG